MLIFIVRRVLYSIPVLLATSLIIFTFVSITGDPLGRLRANPRITQAELHAVAHAKNLDKPVIVRYGYWLRDAITKEFGTTLYGNIKIWPQIQRVLWHTVQLLVTVEIIAILIGVLIGVLSAVKQYSLFDYLATTGSFIGFAMPAFFLALILQIIFVDIYLKWHVRIFYTSQLNSVNPGHGFHFFVDRLQHLALPVATLVALEIAAYSRYMRGSMLEVINSDYVRTARAKGLAERRVIFKHVFRNALIPVATVAALNFGALFGGAIITESIFQLDGMGYFFIQALGASDPYPVMAWLAVTAVMVVVFNLIADIVYGFLDPRIRYD